MIGSWKSICVAMILTVMFTSDGKNVMADQGNELTDIHLKRSLTKEPEYESKKPLYGLAVFGSKNEKLVWMVLDKSADSNAYDRAYVDLNLDGDLTDDGEMFKIEKKSIQIAKLSVRDGYEFSDISIRVSDAKKGVAMVKATFNGELKLGGGYPVDPGTYMKFGESRKQAPIVCFRPETKFQFQRWIERPLKIGGQTDFKVFLGWPGKGHSSFCSTLGHILPKQEIVIATLQYQDTTGETRTVECEFDQRC